MSISPGQVLEFDWVDVPAGPGRYRTRVSELATSFQIARFPVTQRQFAAFAEGAQAEGVAAWFEGLGASTEDAQLIPARFPGETHPQDSVSWFVAMAFCRWASAALGGPTDLDLVAQWPVRLPTDREWEKSARAAGADPFPYGATFDPQAGNGKQTGLGTTSPVGAFPRGASPYGVLDLSGNVWEWVLSRHADDTGGLDDLAIGTQDPRVIRGGCYANAPGHMRASYRGKAGPGATFEILGFRVCRSAPGTSVG